MNIQKSALFAIVFAPMVVANADAAPSVYQNNVGAINLNMLTERFMAFTHMDENISDFVINTDIYGTMTRLDEYGDDGTIVNKPKDEEDEEEFEPSLSRLVWADVQYLNTRAEYNDNVSERNRIRMETIGFNTKEFDLVYGSISFGAFLGNIAEDIFSFTGNGFTFGVFSHYKMHDFDVTVLANNGSINNNSGNNMFNNSWYNVAADTSMNISLTDSVSFRPKVYVGYTSITADDFKINGDVVPSKYFRFWNVVPSAEISAKLARNFYGSLFGKYVWVNGDTEKNVYLNGAAIDKTEAKDYAEFGLDLEYDYKKFVFTGYVHKQIEGFDGWIGKLGLKYVF